MKLKLVDWDPEGSPVMVIEAESEDDLDLLNRFSAFSSNRLLYMNAPAGLVLAWSNGNGVSPTCH